VAAQAALRPFGIYPEPSGTAALFVLAK
jgi:hypothetical protein